MSSSLQKPDADPYEILGVTPDMPFSEVRVAHRRLIRELHPDVNPTARDRFDQVQTAFEALRIQNSAPKSGATDASARSGATAPDAAERARRAPVETKEPDPGAKRATKSPRSQRLDRSGIPSDPSPPRSRLTPREEVRPPAPASAPHAYPDQPVPEQTSMGDSALRVNMVPGRDRLLVQPRAQMQYVLLDFQLSELVGNSTMPLNLSLVLDHSSSMQRDDKLQRLKEAVARIIDMMNPLDYLSIITFGDRATVLLPSTPLGNKRAAKEALDAIRCRGGTEISTGLRAGLQELQAHSATLISQMIVLTDGQTYGDEDVCLELAAQSGERQVQITALGLGDDWNNVLLDELAARTGGQADYVQDADQLTRAFEDQLRTLQLTALRNMNMTIHPTPSGRLLRATWVAPGIKTLPVPTETPSATQPVRIELGRVSTDRDYRLLLEFVVASRSPGSINVADVVFSYDVPSLGRENEQCSSRITSTFVESWDSEPPVNPRVHDALRKITAHRLQEQALHAIQEGQTQKGTASLRTAAKHLEAAGSPELAKMALAEADRVERQGQVLAGNMKRILYGTRGLG